MRTFTGLFENDSQAQLAMNALADAGIAREDIRSVSFGDAMPDAQTAAGHGDYVVTVRTSDGQAELATSILRQNGAMSVDEITKSEEATQANELAAPIKPEDYRREDNPADDTLPPPLPR